MNSVTQAAGWPPVPSAASRAVAPDPGAQAAQAPQDDGSQPRSYYVGECGHRVPGGPALTIGPCDNCDANTT